MKVLQKAGIILTVECERCGRVLKVSSKNFDPTKFCKSCEHQSTPVDTDKVEEMTDNRDSLSWVWKMCGKEQDGCRIFGFINGLFLVEDLETKDQFEVPASRYKKTGKLI